MKSAASAGAALAMLLALSAPALADQKYNPFRGETDKVADAGIGELKATEPSIDFGEISAGEDRPIRSAVFSNVGTAPMKIDNIDLASSDGTLTVLKTSCSNATLAAKASCSVTLAWDPHRGGKLQSDLTITHTGASRTTVVAIRGSAKQPTESTTSGQNGAIVSSSKDAVAFGDVAANAEAITRTVVLSNTGDRPTRLGSVAITEMPANLELINSNDGACRPDRELQPGAGCVITLSWRPKTPGVVGTDLIISHNARSGIIVVPITGRAIAPAATKATASNVALQPNASEINLGQVIARKDTATRSLILSNPTPSPLTFGDVVLNVAKPSSFAVSAQDCTSQPLRSGASCSINIAWTPKEEGAVMGEIIVNHNGAERLTPVAIKGDAITTNNAFAFNPTTGTGFGVLNISKDHLEFGKATANKDRIGKAVTMSNGGDHALQLSAIDVIGAPDALSIDDQGCRGGSTLESGASCELRLVYAPKSDETLSTDIVIRHTGLRGVSTISVSGAAAFKDPPPAQTARSALDPSAPAGSANTSPEAFGADLPGNSESGPSSDLRLIGISPHGALIRTGTTVLHVNPSDRITIDRTSYEVLIVADTVVLASKGNRPMILALGRSVSFYDAPAAHKTSAKKSAAR